MNALILCHPKIIRIKNNKIQNHWYSEIIESLINFVGVNINTINFDTVDILSGGTIIDDCFSKQFIDINSCKYDMIIMPDCGGPWYDLQCQNNINELIKLLIMIISMLKHKSSILIDKFLCLNLRTCTINLLKNLGFQLVNLECDLFGTSYSNYICAIRI